MIRRPVKKGAVRLGAAALAGATALSGCSFRGVDSIPLPGGPDLGDRPETLTIEFANVLDLVPQSVVKVNDVSVGKVDKIDLAGGNGQGWHAVVTVKVRRDTRLPANAIATIGQTSLLGEKYVALSPPTSEPAAGSLANGDRIPLARTTRSTEIEEVLSAFSLLLNGGGIEQVSTISRELQAAMNGREDTIKSVLHRVNTFAGTLDRNRDAINRALDSIDRLSGKLAAERKTINDTIDRTGPAVSVLNRNRADLTRMLVALDKLSRTTTTTIRRSKADLLANLKDLDTIVRNLNKAGDALPKALGTMITFPFPSTFGNVIKGDYGNVRLTVDLDFESIAKNLLGGTDLESQLGSGQQMRQMLKVPNLTLPQTPLGALPQMPGSAATPGATPTPTPSKRAAGTATTPTARPAALGQGDLQTLLLGGMS
ncbi:MCE family protein [Actinomadura parmotrematis]|uniref:MCE family protein n=1 Tax=Actinomadura parmotrematis TaxID=2864039 RepID=A0ABS7FYD5_9ACTN|nr:MCE family protein [Actinomadura parmotrematis]MBW8485155.1 MCE family protein [Actinomadura parmotrematis]